jgi:hypothetical protein
VLHPVAVRQFCGLFPAFVEILFAYELHSIASSIVDEQWQDNWRELLQQNLHA